MIKNIIFDYGAVIFDIDHQLTIQAFKDIGLQAENDFFYARSAQDAKRQDYASIIARCRRRSQHW